jgi:hypothetical protein
MGLFDWLFGHKDSGEGDERLRLAIDRVIEGTDPRLKAISDVRERLAPAVSHALEFTHQLVASLPPCIEMIPETWSQSPILRAMFVRPADIARTLSSNQELRSFLDSAQAQEVERIHCVVAATRTERTVLGSAMEGEMLRQDVAQKTVGFGDFRLVGFSKNEELLNTRIEEVVLEGLVMAALRAISGNRQRNEQLGLYRQLLLTRLRLLEQSGAGLNEVLVRDTHEGRDIDRLRRDLAANEAELMSLKSDGFDAVLNPIIEALHKAEDVVKADRVVLHLNSMNIVVESEAADASEIELLEFSTANPARPRRVAFLATFPKNSVVAQRFDLDAALRMI